MVLVERLQELGAIDDLQFDRLVNSGGLSGQDFGKILQEEYRVDPMSLLLARARAYNLAPINLEHFKLTDQCFEFLELEFCKNLNILPVGKAGRYVVIATSDPMNPSLRAKIEAETKRPFVFMIALEDQLSQKFTEDKKAQAIPSVGFGDVVESLGLQFDIDTEKVQEEDFEDEESAPVVLLTNRIIEDAYFSGASDIHIEPFERQARVRVRIDGQCRERLTLPNNIARGLLSRLKVMSNLDITERRLSQDGRIAYKFFNRKGIDVDLRLSTCPMNNGEGCVMRLLDKQKSTLPLTDLGFSVENLGKYRQCIHQPHGMIMHCGPTGSGKSMTLYSALGEINDPEICIRTAEDPIEYTLPGIIQVQMNRKIGVTFASTLRGFLRQDPDVILVGEIRDAETAGIAVEAALTGHLLFTTLHTNDAAYSISRLTDLGIEPFMVSSSLICVCAQRLLRSLCNTCKQRYEPEGNEAEILQRGLEWTGEISRRNPAGCPNCQGSGYRGRAGIHEIMVVNEELVRGINMAVEATELKAVAIRSGMKTLHQDALLKVKEGRTSVEEAVATVPPDREDLDRMRRSSLGDAGRQAPGGRLRSRTSA
ncbi:MAG: GspE/PulE family protein [Opitutales bacterium]